MSDKKNNSPYVLTYIFFLCLVSALVLATTSEALKPLQKIEKENAQYKQLLISCKILDPEGYFIENKQKKRASKDEINRVYKTRVIPMVATSTGQTLTFEEAGLNYTRYISQHHKQGFSQLKYKLFYLVKTPDKKSVFAYIIPINGQGLWDAIYGYLSLKPNKTEILGITFYDQKETPGLGAVITEPWWQEQFNNKSILFRGKNNNLSVEQSTFMVIVEKPAKIMQMNTYEKNNAVDAISGATITSNGVEECIKIILKQYRNFLLKEGSNEQKMEKVSS